MTNSQEVFVRLYFCHKMYKDEKRMFNSRRMKLPSGDGCGKYKIFLEDKPRVLRYTLLLILKIYGIYNMNYRFSVLEMYIIRTYKIRATIFSIISIFKKLYVLEHDLYSFLKIISLFSIINRR